MANTSTKPRDDPVQPLSTGVIYMNQKEYVPGKEPPPIADRPVCQQCFEPLHPVIEGGDGAYAGETPEPRHWDGKYHGYGVFCSLKCAARFANAAFAAGYRRTK